MKVREVVLGSDMQRACRPEMRFGGIQELIARIKTDVGISKAQLDMPEHTRVKEHRLFHRG